MYTIFSLLLVAILAAPAAAATTCGTVPIKIDGSTAYIAQATAWAAAYSKACPKAKVTVSGGGSPLGVKDVCSGAVAAAMTSSEFLPYEATGSGNFYKCVIGGASLTQVPIMYDGLTVIVAPGSDGAACVKLSGGLKSADLVGIFSTGTIKKWSQINPKCASTAITPTGQITGGGAYTVFATVLKFGTKLSVSNYVPVADEAVIGSVNKIKGSLGFTSYGDAVSNSAKVVIVSVDGLSPTPNQHCEQELQTLP